MKPVLLLLSFIGVLPWSLSLLCPVGHKYYVIKTQLTWSAAQTYCRNTYTDLATIESQLDWLRLSEELKRKAVTYPCWVGLYNDVDTWRWTFNEIPIKTTYHQWESSQPDNFGGTESCCSMGPGGYWWDFPCTKLLPFVCYNAKNSYTTRYIGVSSSMDWNGAKTHCRMFHTDLAFAMNAADNTAMQEITAVQGMSWIGGYRDSWKWSDGQNTSNVLWLSGQPNNYFQSENCGVLVKRMFKDVKCNGLYYFICHINQPVIERQMVRLDVKSDLSIYNSDVQSAILDLIKKKLEEKGMPMNINVTWKVHSNGQVFRKKKTFY